MPDLVDFASGECVPLFDKFTIGRSLDSAHCIEDIAISRKHCQFILKEGDWFLVDLSSNGLFLNDSKPQRNVPTLLKHNDTLQIANYLFGFRTHVVQVNNDILEVIDLDGTEEPVVEVAGSSAAASAASGTSDNDRFEDELTCSICTELFINAVTLNCQHSYCELCIATWRKNNKNCPICRVIITSQAPTLTINNMVSLVIGKKSPEEIETRKQTVEARMAQTTGSAAAQAAATTRGRRGRPARGATARGRAPRRGRSVAVNTYIDLNTDSESETDQQNFFYQDYRMLESYLDYYF